MILVSKKYDINHFAKRPASLQRILLITYENPVLAGVSDIGNKNFFIEIYTQQIIIMWG